MEEGNLKVPRGNDMGISGGARDEAVETGKEGLGFGSNIKGDSFANLIWGTRFCSPSPNVALHPEPSKAPTPHPTLEGLPALSFNSEDLVASPLPVMDLHAPAEDPQAFDPSLEGYPDLHFDVGPHPIHALASARPQHPCNDLATNGIPISSGLLSAQDIRSAPLVELLDEVPVEKKAYLSDFSFFCTSRVYISSNSGADSETKACVTKETAVSIPTVPKHALQAFVLLKESSAAQSVVSALVADKNVWDAVMQNEKVMEFFQSQQTTGMDFNDKESCVDNEFNDQESVKIIDDEYDGKSSESGFMGFIENVKIKVAEMVKNMSDFIQNLFGGSIAGNKSMDEKGSASGMLPDKSIAASFMGLAILVIMVVVMKRS
ncbi:uncharacterized protein LOC122092319 [Macadamia integrifolia]|uniref:uncharacterized protein LOC122092319 n=1 Tax=Macadamia integrifolia TaxID=60698 RepID=UPI001C529706|nr:uncharacterized protein LOC122092319 [Macadamia integrifolia]